MWVKDDEGGHALRDYKYLVGVNAKRGRITLCDSKGYIIRNDTEGSDKIV